jgi:hypothetical protein
MFLLYALTAIVRSRRVLVTQTIILGLVVCSSLAGQSPDDRRQPSDQPKATDAASADSSVTSQPGKKQPEKTGGLGTDGRYERYCQKCHDQDGSGRRGRALYPEIPDFRETSWQRRKTDAQLMASILHGKNEGMPGFANSFGRDEARFLVAKVRSFAPGVRRAPTEDRDFDDEFRRLLEEMNKLAREFRALASPRQNAALSRDRTTR